MLNPGRESGKVFFSCAACSLLTNESNSPGYIKGTTLLLVAPGANVASGTTDVVLEVNLTQYGETINSSTGLYGISPCGK